MSGDAARPRRIRRAPRERPVVRNRYLLPSGAAPGGAWCIRSRTVVP